MSTAMYVPGASVAASRRLLRRLLGNAFPTAQIGYYSLSEVLADASDEDHEAIRLLIDRVRRAPGKDSMPISILNRGETAVHFSATYADSLMSTPNTTILAVHPSGRIVGMAHTELASDHVLDYNQNLLGLRGTDPVVEFGRLFVLSDYRGFGIADHLFHESMKAMWDEPLPEMPPTFIIVECDNDDGIRFFSKFEKLDLARKVLEEDGTPHIVSFDDTDHYELLLDADAFYFRWNEIERKLGLVSDESDVAVSSDYGVFVNVIDKDGYRHVRRPEEIDEDSDFLEDEAGYLIYPEAVNFRRVRSTDPRPLVSVNEAELIVSPHALISAYDNDGFHVRRRADSLHLSRLFSPSHFKETEIDTDAEVRISKRPSYQDALELRLSLESSGEELTRNISSVDLDGSPDSFRIVHRRRKGDPSYQVRYPVRRTQVTDGHHLYVISSNETGKSIIVNGYVLYI